MFLASSAVQRFFDEAWPDDPYLPARPSSAARPVINQSSFSAIAKACPAPIRRSFPPVFLRLQAAMTKLDRPHFRCSAQALIFDPGPSIFSMLAACQCWSACGKLRETRLYQVAPISTNLVLSYIAEHVLGMPRSY
jgi:hypothetical protein